MASIGDIWMALRGDGTPLLKDAKKEGEKAGAAGSKSFGAKFKAGLSGIKGGILGGLGLGVGLGAVGVATQALGKLTDVMGDAVQAAVEEEKSIAKLDAALKANVEGYQGNTAEIEKVLAARMRLGFADDEQRESLATLVAVTKDSTKALKLQRVAMDLARLRNIDLAAASDIVGKVSGGNIGILSRYGIAIKKGATATEALAELTKLAAGQAEAFAETSQGKLLASQIKVGEAIEKLGTRLLPIVVAATEGAADAVETLALTFDQLGTILDGITTGELPKTSDEALALADRLADIAEGIPVVGTLFKELAGNTLEDMVRMAANTDYMKDAVKDDLVEVDLATTRTREEWDKLAASVLENADQMIVSVKDWRDATISAARDVVTKAYQIIEDKAALTAINVEKAELRKVIATGNATKEQKARFKELTEDQQQLILDLADNGQDQSKVVQTALAQLNAQLKDSHGQERKAIQATIDALQRLATQARTTKRLIDGVTKGKTQKSGKLEYAEGGWVDAPLGKPVRATVHGGEYILTAEQAAPMAPTFYAPKVPAMATVAAPMAPPAGSSGNTYQVALPPTVQYDSPRDVVDIMRALEERGYM